MPAEPEPAAVKELESVVLEHTEKMLELAGKVIEPAETELVEPEPVQSELVEPEPVEPESAAGKGIELTEPEVVEPEPAAGKVMKPAEPELVEPEPVEPEPA